MASEIKVDTVSEKTSGSGVTIDGLLIKDGGISGDVSLIGTTPTFTIGDAGAEDAALVFDGNAQDFYIALDDSADDLLIGLGSTVGTTPAVSIDENLQVKIVATTASTSATTGSFIAAGGAGVAADLHVGDDVTLISDSAVLGFGADKDTTLTHTDGTGLTLNSTNKLCFNDASQYIQGASATVLDIAATDEIELTATLLDVNANLDVSGTSLLPTLGVMTAKDLGQGIHIRASDSSATVTANEADFLVIEKNSDSGMSILSATDGTGNIYFGDSGDNDIGKIQYSHGSNLMYFTVNASEAMRITSDGNIQQGTTSNAGRLSVVTPSDERAIYGQINKSSGVGTSVIYATCTQDTTNSSYNLFDGQSPSGRFLVRDSSNVVNTNNSYGSASDERIKQDITDANSQWNDIKALKVRNFKLKADPTKTQLGLIAQELETANMNGLVEDAPPEKEDVAYHSDFGTIVSGTEDNGATPIKDEDGNITGYEDVFTAGQKVKSVKYSVLYMKAIKALQEAQTRIETLESKVTALEG